MSATNPCLDCGACCACFRVSFYWGETDAAPDGLTPVQLTTAISPHRVAMLGTDQPNPRCTALQGTIGEQVACRIYPLRPSPCREFNASWLADGVPNLDCDKARAKFNLPALLPESVKVC